MRAGKRGGGGELGEKETESVNLKAFEEGNKDIPILFRGRERNDIGRNGTEEGREAADLKPQGGTEGSRGGDRRRGGTSCDQRKREWMELQRDKRVKAGARERKKED